MNEISPLMGTGGGVFLWVKNSFFDKLTVVKLSHSWYNITMKRLKKIKISDFAVTLEGKNDI